MDRATELDSSSLREQFSFQAKKIVEYLQFNDLEKIISALEVRERLKKAGLIIGPTCIEGWKWLINLWPSEDPENCDVLRMVIDKSFKFLPDDLQRFLRLNWLLNPVEFGVRPGGPAPSDVLKKRSDEDIMLALIASTAFDFHQESVTEDPYFKQHEKGNGEEGDYEEYWRRIEELVTSIGIKTIFEHLGFLRNKNFKIEDTSKHKPYNFTNILLSNEESDLAFKQAQRQIERIKRRNGGYLTIHGAKLRGSLTNREFEKLKENLTRLAALSGDQVVLGLETQGLTKIQIDELLEEVDGLKLTWDIAHVYLEDLDHKETKSKGEEWLEPEDFFDYLRKGKIGMVHLSQPKKKGDQVVDSHQPLFDALGLISNDFLKRLFKQVSEYNLKQLAQDERVRLIFECPLRIGDYKRILDECLACSRSGILVTP